MHTSHFIRWKTATVAIACLSLPIFAAEPESSPPNQTAAPSSRAMVRNGLKLSGNRRYLMDAVTGTPVFILADTAWNLGALKLEEIDTYLQSRADHGFNTVMFALNFAPQAEEKNAYGEPAYIGAEHNELNPAYFANCDQIIQHAADRGLYVMLYALWGMNKNGTMRGYSPAQLSQMGLALGKRYAGVPNVILCVGGEAASPHAEDRERAEALGKGLKEGCGGRNLVTIHPEAGHSGARFFAKSGWLDFSLIQAKSSCKPESATYDAAALVLRDWTASPSMPTMMAEHRYEVGTDEDPLIQRRSLYQCVFAGGCGYAYGHNALWQMTPHTAQRWMLQSWKPGVKSWSEALDTPAVRQLRYIRALLLARPYFERIPDQGLVLAGQGADVATRIQATRDGTPEGKDATYLMAYLSAPAKVTLNTAVIAGRTLNAYWFSPETGKREVVRERFANAESLTVEARSGGRDWVLVVEDSSRNYEQLGKD